MINDFIDNVASMGAEALLPQDLNMTWLNHLSRAAKKFICDITDDATSDKPVDIFEQLESNLLLIAVTEIVHCHENYAAEFDAYNIPEEDMVNHLKCYALSVIYENIRRKTDIKFKLPEIEDILSEQRLIDIETNNPALTDALYDFMMEEF